MNDDFDIERYRIEHPMDYIKAVEILKSCSNKDEVFSWIYDITRLHIPNTLYKYFSLTDDENLNDLKLNALAEKKVFLANSGDFNDPFENKAFYYRNEKLNCFEELRRFNGHTGDDIMFTSKAASFTKTGFNSMPMWAHYSNNHHGFCVAYNMREPRNTQLSASTMPIQYTDERIDITDILVNYVDLVLREKRRQMGEGKKIIIIDNFMIIYTTLFLQNIKQSSWQYEQEFRCSAGKTSIGMPFITAVPSAIYAGGKCFPLYLKKLCDIAYQLNIPFYLMTFTEFNQNYQMAPKRII